MVEKQNNLRKYWKIIGALGLVVNALGVIFILLYPKRWREFISGQKKEFKELSSGQEDYKRFWQDSKKLLKDFFIPHLGNNYKPKSLRPKSLVTYLALAILVKFIAVVFLFIAYPSPAELSAIISKNIVSLVNQSRAEEGVEPVSENQILLASARLKAQDMIFKNYFAHDSPDGRKPWQWINRAQYDYVYAGENLAMDFTTAESVHEAFLKSPSHQRNILNPKYKEIGIAVLNGELNGHKTILLVEFFGTQRKDLPNLAEVKPTPTQTAVNLVPIVKTQTAGEPAAVAGEQLILEVVPSLPPLNQEQINQEIITIQKNITHAKSGLDYLVYYSNVFFIAFLIFLLITICLNFFIKIKVQYPAVILQSFVVLAFILAMLLVNFHFLEGVSDKIIIL
ncbi:MAG TPA: CAP domain-containing protein [Patescibacteria group bacterium]|nr:CAP domain-containing protein [Patescibacteria group bacterium]